MNIHEVSQRLTEINGNTAAMMTEGPRLIASLARIVRIYEHKMIELNQRITAIEEKLNDR